jgi:hypothetical protein
MRISAFVLPCLAFAFLGLACDDGGSGGGGTSGGAAGTSTGGSAGSSSGGSSGSSTGGSAGTSSGGSSGSGTGGTGGECSVISGYGCAPLWECMNTNCSDEIGACYGANYMNNDATGSLCEDLWLCSKDTCTCGDNACLIGTCYTSAPADCQSCIPAISQCLQDNCQAIADACPPGS